MLFIPFSISYLNIDQIVGGKINFKVSMRLREESEFSFSPGVSISYGSYGLLNSNATIDSVSAGASVPSVRRFFGNTVTSSFIS